MDLRLYYQKIRDTEERIPQKYPVVVSHETTDGGKEGTLTEVPKRIAARLLVEGLARLASPEEAEAFHALMAEAKRVAEQTVEATKVHLTVLSAAELNKLRGGDRPRKE